MTHKIDFTAQQIERIRKLRAAGLSWEDTGRVMGCGKTKVRKAVDPEYVEYLKRYEKARYRAGGKNEKPHNGGNQWLHADRGPKITPREIAERRPAPHRDYTAFMLGDPAPGRSALDRRHGRAG